ncbi:MAG: GIY-YIG nuclease family protein [Planctomycetota bacterium]
MSADQDSLSSLGRLGGVYVVVLRLQSARRVCVGALGEIEFRPGRYAYVGSARNGLRARLRRHLRNDEKRLHWHVDYLRRFARPTAVFVREGERASECKLSQQVAAAADASVKGFGCSDCRCASHLHRFARPPGRRLQSLGGLRRLPVE